MTLDLFLRGLAIGFAIAFALGPIGLLVIRRTVERGWAHGFSSGLGVATADAGYGAVAAFGLTAVTNVLVGIDRPLGVVGGAILVVLALRTLRSVARPGRRAAAPPEGGRVEGLVKAWASMVALTATNPATILSFTALFAGIGAGTRGAAGAAAVVGGVFLGSAAWWALLTGAIARLRARLTPSIVRGLNVVSAALIGGFGLVAIVLGVAG